MPAKVQGQGEKKSDKKKKKDTSSSSRRSKWSNAVMHKARNVVRSCGIKFARETWKASQRHIPKSSSSIIKDATPTNMEPWIKAYMPRIERKKARLADQKVQNRLRKAREAHLRGRFLELEVELRVRINAEGQADHLKATGHEQYSASRMSAESRLFRLRSREDITKELTRVSKKLSRLGVFIEMPSIAVKEEAKQEPEANPA